MPIFDPQKMPSSAGGFPWKADGDYTTVVYIKNETNVVRKYSIGLIYGSGLGYTPGVKEIKAGQTVAIDFRQLRDSQTPDPEGSLIPLNVDKGQIAWSSHGPENKMLSGRSEQVSLQNGFASTYSCANCCPNRYYDSWLTPVNVLTEVGEITNLISTQQDQNCYGQVYPPYQADVSFWDSTDWAVASVYNGSATGQGLGSANIQASWEATNWWYEEGRCDYIPVPVMEEGPVEVINVTVNVPPNVMDGTTANLSVIVTGGVPTAYLWSFETPSGAGNNPNVSFTAPTAASTQANAHWFAKPNNPCSASFSSQYTIKIRVSFQNRGPITKEAPYTVSVGNNWGGSVDPPATSAPAGTLETAFSNGLWRVVGPGTFQRVPSSITMRTPQNSQFYNKTLKHEEEHVKQFATGIFSDLYVIANIMPSLLQMTDTNKQVLEQRVFQAVQDWRAEQFQILGQRLPQGERDAYAVSDPIAPQYLFNNCGRF